MVGGGDETCYSLSGSAASKIALDGYGRFFQGLLAGKEPEKGARTLGRSPLISEAVELVRGSIGDRPRNSAWLCWLILALVESANGAAADMTVTGSAVARWQVTREVVDIAEGSPSVDAAGKSCGEERR